MDRLKRFQNVQREQPHQHMVIDKIVRLALYVLFVVVYQLAFFVILICPAYFSGVLVYLNKILFN